MAKITKLTADQEAAMVAKRDEWLAIGRNTAPIDRDKAEAAISAMYAAIGKDRPKFMFFQSPWQAGMAIAIMKTISKDGFPANLGANLEANLWANLRANLGDNLRANLRANLGDNLDLSYLAGQHWCAWEVFYDLCNEIGVPYSEKDRSTLDLWLEQSKTCHWWWPKDGLVIATDRHTILLVDDSGRLHCETGPAVAYADGWKQYYWHGVHMPEYIIERPNEITVAAIDAEANAEIRRVMVDRFGMERYVRESGSKLIHSLPDDYGLIGLRTAKLYRKEQNGDEPIIVLDMLNSTPEPDGTTKRYMIRISPHSYGGMAAKDCLAAMASTYRMPDDSLLFKDYRDYSPMVET